MGLHSPLPGAVSMGEMDSGNECRRIKIIDSIQASRKEFIRKSSLASLGALLGASSSSLIRGIGSDHKASKNH